ncbi:hypothetical protein HYC85_023361 [Camellia sinensis]|uniref:Uncharacterized protein n=1 Tax=Camellia sinensis TaxID=4442 RepID=A0A7J7GED3_CAMSI|nr:hypothetical protein HYC85_023361 [Camellia sinensis]
MENLSLSLFGNHVLQFSISSPIGNFILHLSNIKARIRDVPPQIGVHLDISSIKCRCPAILEQYVLKLGKLRIIDGSGFITSITLSRLDYIR